MLVLTPELPPVLRRPRMPKLKLDPLPSAAFQILLSLAGEDLHGYGIMRQIADQTGGRMRLGPGTLYSSIQTLLEEKFIEEVDAREDARLGEERRRYYRLTSAGANWHAPRRKDWPTCYASLGSRRSLGATMSEKIYLWLWRLYPSHFREAYREEAVQLFRDRARHERGFFRGLRLWLDLLADLAISVSREYRASKLDPFKSHHR